jgi:hypothetical protein
MKQNTNKLIIYQAKNGAIKLRGDAHGETIWANQSQIATVFGIDQSVVSRHINNVLKDGDVHIQSNMQKMHIANSDKPVSFYSLDIILSVGYRTNSSKAIAFRKWATSVLRQHVLEGYTNNKKRVGLHYQKFITLSMATNAAVHFHLSSSCEKVASSEQASRPKP